MVKLTTAYVEKKCSQTQASKSLTKELKKDHLRKITHLYMNDKFINTIGNFAACRNLRVVYLQNNCITKIENLHFATNITHLYLQHNNISKIENLNCLQNLTSLFLGYNNISVVEGLENAENLTELHVERQNISAGESLCFDPRSCHTIAMSLKILNITGNQMTTINELSNFQMLESLEANNNYIENIKDLTETIKSLPKLEQLSLQDNPVTKCYRYRENIIANTDLLACLDGKNISPISRRFMKKFQIERHLQATTTRSKMTLSDDITNSLNLPPAFKRSVTRAIFQHPGPKLSISVASASGELQPQMFPSWASVPTIRGFKDCHLTPRPLWKSSSRNKPRLTFSASNANIIELPPL
ncbi:protein phosphatase 1 regulatory subunit 42-like [Athalia rosae]|uniref:protein phosphatase 1 regulatory subunit 42-like n=1 Tax=Athalia rosae TaxID=37344 RepID=UPI000626E2A5|nr:protein phosphatase 1 regulatory subunit 42-like [Athalia rosae]